MMRIRLIVALAVGIAGIMGGGVASADPPRGELFAQGLQKLDHLLRDQCPTNEIMLDLSSRTGLERAEPIFLMRFLESKSCKVTTLPPDAWEQFQGDSLLTWFKKHTGHRIAVALTIEYQGPALALVTVRSSDGCKGITWPTRYKFDGHGWVFDLDQRSELTAYSSSHCDAI